MRTAPGFLDTTSDRFCGPRHREGVFRDTGETAGPVAPTSRSTEMTFVSPLCPPLTSPVKGEGVAILHPDELGERSPLHTETTEAWPSIGVYGGIPMFLCEGDVSGRFHGGGRRDEP
jgi:hypothetical protein